MTRPTGGRRGGDGGVQWAKALVLIAVLVVVGIVILAKTQNSPAVRTSTPTHHGATGSSTTSTVPAPTTTTTLLPTTQVKVQVLNGVGTGSYAGQWSTKLKAQFGYITEPADNATTKVPTSIIYVLTPGYQSEANQLATNVGLAASAVYPTIPPPAAAPIPTTERATANLVLVVGPDLQGTA
jgi:cytoskeletal protein RodZ